MASELKPCPFCGSEARLSYSIDGTTYVGCNKTSCCGEGGNDGVLSYRNAKDATAAWNRRAVEGINASASAEPHPDTRRLLMDAIERTVKSCAKQLHEGSPPSRWVVDYAGICDAALRDAKENGR